MAWKKWYSKLTTVGQFIRQTIKKNNTFMELFIFRVADTSSGNPSCVAVFGSEDDGEIQTHVYSCRRRDIPVSGSEVETTLINNTGIQWTNNNQFETFLVMDVFNVSDGEDLCIGHSVGTATTGTEGNIEGHEITAKLSTISGKINFVALENINTGQYEADTNVGVLGSN